MGLFDSFMPGETAGVPNNVSLGGGLLDFLKTPQGQAIASGVATYAAGARRGTPVNNIGRGLLGGLTSYADQQAQAEAQKIKSMQMQQMQMQMEQMKKAQERQNQWESSVQGAFTPKFEQAPFGQQQEAQLADQISAFPDFKDAARLTNESGSPAQMQTGMEFDPMKLKAALPFAPPGIQDEIIKSTFGMGADARTAEQKNWEYAQKLPPEMRSAFLAKSGGTSPATVQEWEYFNKLSPQEQGKFLEMKRNPQIMNLGGSQGVRAPGGGIGESYPVTPKPEQMPAFQAAQESEKVKAKTEAERVMERPMQASKMRGATAKAENVNNMIDEAKKKAGFWTTGFVGSMVETIPGTPAHDLGKTLNTIKANLGFAELQEMRNNSPTGGALGQVTERELSRLESAWAALEQSQSKEQFVRNLDNVKQMNESALRRARETQAQMYGEQQIAPTKPALPKFGERKNGYYYKGGDPAYPSSWVKVKP